MRKLIFLFAVSFCSMLLADRTANQTWVKNNFAPTNIVPRVEALEQQGGGGVTASTATNIANHVSRAMKPVKIGDYLWEISTEGESWNAATNRLMKVYPSWNPYGCTGVSYGRFHGRNLDWYYDNGCSFVVRVPKQEGRYALIGVADGIGGLTEDCMMKEEWNDAFYSLPFSIGDGINENGVVIQQNVIPTNYTKSAVWRTNRRDNIICFCMVRYALEKATTALEAATIINNHVFVPEGFNYDIHYQVSDKTVSLVVEDGNIYTNSVMTNFRIGGVSTNVNGTLVWNTVESYGQGLERYDRIITNGLDKTTFDGIIKTMEDVWYTKSYDTKTTPFWYTELCDANSPDLNVMNALNNQSLFYVAKTNEYAIFTNEHDKASVNYRGGKTWQTVHTSIYDKDMLSLSILTQEDRDHQNVFYINQYKKVMTANDVCGIVTNNVDTSKTYNGTAWSVGQVCTQSVGSAYSYMTNTEVRWTGDIFKMHIVGTRFEGNEIVNVDDWYPTCLDVIVEEGKDPYMTPNTNLNSDITAPLKTSTGFFGQSEIQQLISHKIGTTNYVVEGDVINALGLAYRVNVDNATNTIARLIDYTPNNDQLVSTITNVSVDAKQIVVGEEITYDKTTANKAYKDDLGRIITDTYLTTETYSDIDSSDVTTIASISLDSSKKIKYYTALTASTLTLTFSAQDVASLKDGAYTWEVMLSSSVDISKITFSNATYVGNDNEYNPNHSCTRIDTSRTAHVFTVRMIKNGSTCSWVVAYNYSFVG